MHLSYLMSINILFRMHQQPDCPQSPFHQSNNLFKHTSSIHLMQTYKGDSPERDPAVPSRAVHSTAHMDYHNSLPTYPRTTLNSQLYIPKSPQQSNEYYDRQSNSGNSSTHIDERKPPSIQFIVNEYERTQISQALNMSNMPHKLDEIFAKRAPITSQQFKMNLLTNEGMRPIYVTQEIGEETLRNLEMNYEIDGKPFAKIKAESVKRQQNLPETNLKSRQSSKIQDELVQQCSHLQKKVSNMKKSNETLCKLSQLISQIGSNNRMEHTLRIYQRDGGLDFNLLKKFIQKTIISNEK